MKVLFLRMKSVFSVAILSDTLTPIPNMVVTMETMEKING